MSDTRPVFCVIKNGNSDIDKPMMLDFRCGCGWPQTACRVMHPKIWFASLRNWRLAVPWFDFAL
jgi:hypothetical protein